LTTPNCGSVEARFDREANRWDRIYDDTGPWPVRAWNRLARANVTLRFERTFDVVSNWRGASVLDIGCGSGRYLDRAAALGATRLVGIDSSPSMLRLAETRLQQHHEAEVELKCARFPVFNVDDDFDVVIINGVFDYVTEPGVFLRHAVARCDGRLIATFPSRLAPRSIPRSCYWRMRGLATAYYTRRAVSALFGRSGLSDVSIDRIGPILFASASSRPSMLR
jgi:2-polyprenyl-3-methyl-5-hydroxy-6-metoxy-1,4-benzoquinol methylase